jgi:type IV secretion system protein VirB10
MSENQHIDPSLLEDENPAGLTLKNKPRGIKRINKKGLLVGAALIGGAAIVATTTFNQAGSGVSDAAKDAVANQSKTAGRPGALKRDALWYANVPDKVAAADPTPAPTLPANGGNATGGAAPATGAASMPEGVPDLTGKAVSPLEAATAPRVGGGQLGANGQRLTPAEQQAQQQALQTAQRKQQELDSAMKAGLAAQGFGEKSQVAQGGPAAARGTAGGLMPTSYQQPLMPQQREDDPNKQERKDAFLKGQQNATDTDYSASMKTAPRSKFEVKAGAVIPAVMIGGINSDLPGQVIAQVRENVYDTKTGQYLLIPQGSRLVGLYDAHVAYGQQRILLAWNRIIYPDGSSFDLKGMPGADKAGYAGFFDQVDNHYFKIFGSAVLMSFISAGVQLSQPNNGSSSGTNQAPSVSQTVGAALGQQIGQTAMTITQKNLNIQPTLEVRPGYLFNVMVTADMILPPAGR